MRQRLLFTSLSDKSVVNDLVTLLKKFLVACGKISVPVKSLNNSTTLVVNFSSYLPYDCYIESMKL